MLEGYLSDQQQATLPCLTQLGVDEAHAPYGSYFMCVCTCVSGGSFGATRNRDTTTTSWNLSACVFLRPPSAPPPLQHSSATCSSTYHQRPPLRPATTGLKSELVDTSSSYAP